MRGRCDESGAARHGRRPAPLAFLVILVMLVPLLAAASPPVEPFPPGMPGPTVLGDFGSRTVPPRGWSVTPTTAVRDLRPTSSQSQDGRGALRIDGPASGENLNLTRAAVPVTGSARVSLGAAVRPLDATQSLAVTFLDDFGKPVGHATSDTSSTNTWTRVALTAQAPASASSMAVRIVAPPASAAIWGEVLAAESTPRDASFEAHTPLDATWVVDVEGDGSVERVGTSHSGSSSAELRAPAGEGVTLRSRPTPVLPGVSHHFGAWIRAARGAAELTFDWYAADGSVVGSSRHPVNAGLQWTHVGTDDVAPDGASAVSVGVTTNGTATHVWVDDVTLEPASERPPKAGTPRELAELSGFVTTTTSQVVTVGGRPQLVTVVSGDPATFQVFDVQTGQRVVVEPLSGMTNGWALTRGATDRDVFVGGGNGHVWHYDTTTRAFTDLGRATPEASLVWGLATDDVGNVWGASYPGGQLWRWDPAARRFSTWGQVAPGAEYARGLAVDRDAVYVGTGSVRPHILVVPLDGGPTRRIDPPKPLPQGFVKQLQRSGRYLLARFTSNVTGVYDLTASRWVNLPGPPVVTSKSMPSTAPSGQPFYFLDEGRIFKVAASGPDSATPAAVATTTGFGRDRDTAVVPTTIGGRVGVWLVSFDGVDLVHTVELSAIHSVPGRPLPAAPATSTHIDVHPSTLRIKSLATDREHVFLGGFGGPSFAVVDRTGRFVFRYPADTEAFDPVIGEIEGMAVQGGLLYLGSYTGARLLSYDPSHPWSSGTNPKQVASLGPSYQQDRPQAWAVDGARTYFGTVPTYGVLGGAFGWIDGPDSHVVSLRSPVRDQSVTSIAGRGGVAYVGTSRWGGLGLAPTTDTASVFAYDTATRQVLWTVDPAPRGQSVGALLMTDGGQLYGVADGSVFQLDPRTGKRLRTFTLSSDATSSGATWSNATLAEVEGTLYAAFRGGLYAIDPGSWSVVAVTRSGVRPNKLVTDGSALYYPSGSRLMVASANGGGTDH